MKNNRFDTVNKWVNLIQGIAVILGVIFAVWQLHELVVQNEIQNQTLEQTRLADSANLMLNLDATLNSPRYVNIMAAIEGDTQTYPILNAKDGGKGGAFTYDEVEDYLGNYEDIGILAKDNLILGGMAYDDFSYDFEKTWCNDNVQTVIKDDRESNGDFSSPDRFWFNFETLSKAFLVQDNMTCAGMDKE